MLDWILLILASITMIVGILGCILPVIPGPPISFGGLLIIHFTRFADFSYEFLLTMAALAIGITALDYVVPIMGTKQMGGSKYGVWGAGIGLVAGLFFMPIGIIVGPFLGALVGEYMRNKDMNKSLKPALGAFLGFLVGVIMKLFVSILMSFHFVKAIVAA